MILAKFILPFPPSVNQLFPTSGRMRVKSNKYKLWIGQANTMLNKQNIKPITERCVTIYNLNHPDNRLRDAENYTKAITDLLVIRGIIQDDCRRYLKGTIALWSDNEGDMVEVVIIKADAELFGDSF